MTQHRRATALALTLIVVASIFAGPVARADHGVYELPGYAMYEKTQLSVLVIPPNHGQLLNGDSGILNGSDPNELTPFNSYLVAIEDAIQAWEDAVESLGSPWLKAAYQVDVYVLARDSVPPEVAANPDILVVTDEDEAVLLGSATRLDPCVVRMSKSMLSSFSFADMYNVTGQEFGHCLGLEHVGSQGGVDPTSEKKHPDHDVMNGLYSHPIGEDGTHLHCVSNLNILALEFSMGHVNDNFGALPGPGPHATTYVLADYYGDTCHLPPANWRTYSTTVPDGGTAEPPPQPSPSPTDEDPTITTQIVSPSDKSRMGRKSLVRVTGTAAGGDSGSVYVAIARSTSKNECAWWSTTTRTFTTSSCLDPLWNDAVGIEDWKLKLRGKLPAGKYRALSIGAWGDEAEMCCDRGRNIVHFTLT